MSANSTRPDDPLLTIAVLIPTLWYCRGLQVLSRRSIRGHSKLGTRALLFAAGWATVAAALCAPMAQLADASFSAHMTQHLLLVTVAAPLLALSAPLAPLIWALPNPIRKRLGKLWRRSIFRAARHILGHPITVFLLHSAAIWVWHIPLLYRAALLNTSLHVLEHLTFLGTAVAFFQVLVRAGRPGEMGHGPAISSAFAASLQCGALGMLLVSARIPFYPEHSSDANPWGVSLLEDQQLAGILMWIPGGTAYVIAALFLARAWLHAAASAPPWEVSCHR